ncbi:MAG: Thiol peroxidase, Bcp-type, partial [uncultured Nocardioidaceae bacterium]
ESTSARRRRTGLHAALRHRRERHALHAARAEGGRVLLPRRHDPRVHHAGVRLQRLPRGAARARVRGARGVPRPGREARAVPGARRPRDHAARRRGQVGARGVRRLRREEALRQGRGGRHPVDVRRRRGGPGPGRAVQRQGHRPRRQAPPRPRAGLL